MKILDFIFVNCNTLFIHCASLKSRFELKNTSFFLYRIRSHFLQLVIKQTRKIDDGSSGIKKNNNLMFLEKTLL